MDVVLDGDGGVHGVHGVPVAGGGWEGREYEHEHEHVYEHEYDYDCDYDYEALWRP